MTSILDLLKTASTLVPEYDGNSEKLESVLAALRALNTLVTANNQAAAINAVLSKLTGKARSAVGDDPENLEAIIQGLIRGCKTTVQPEVIQAKLNALKQTGELSKFTEQVEKLTLDLEKCYIAENIPVITATRMATNAGVKALANGIRNQETRMILKSGQFNTLTSAVGKATENENTATVLHYKEQFPNKANGNETRFKNNFRGKNQHRRGNNTRGGHSRGGYSQGNFNQGGYTHSRGGYSQGNFNQGGYTHGNYPRGGYHRGGYSRGGHNQQNNSVFYEHAENRVAPQQQNSQNVGGVQIQQQQQPQIQVAHLANRQ